MSCNNVGRRVPLTLIDPPASQRPDETSVANGEKPLRRTELGLKALAEELAEAVVHLERASLAAKGTGFTARVRDAFEEVDQLQRSAAEEFGRKVGDRMGREALWRRKRGIDVD